MTEPTIARPQIDPTLKALVDAIPMTFKASDGVEAARAKLKQLHTLNLNNIEATNAGLKELARLTQLETLNLGSTLVTDAGMKELAGLQNLRSLYLNNDIWQWSLEIEKSFRKDFVTGVAYVGSQASNIDMTVSNWNNPEPK